jgi:ABC-type branched-chain amino acid transport systems, ATPase component
MALLELRGIDAFYGRVHVLHDVTLDVDAGEIVALIGSNGAGKTTTLRTISGLMHPAAGTITFAGRDITRTPPSKIVGVGIGHSPEGRRLFPRLSVLNNLRMGAYTRRDAPGVKSDIERAFTLFPRLKERQRQLAGTLSGGEQQMLAMGRALMARPKLLMLDEPSLGLAPILVETIFSIIREINSEGTPAGRAERAQSPGGRAPRLRPRDRRHRADRHGQGIAGIRGRPESLPRDVKNEREPGWFPLIARAA